MRVNKYLQTCQLSSDHWYKHILRTHCRAPRGVWHKAHYKHPCSTEHADLLYPDFWWLCAKSLVTWDRFTWEGKSDNGRGAACRSLYWGFTRRNIILGVDQYRASGLSCSFTPKAVRPEVSERSKGRNSLLLWWRIKARYAQVSRHLMTLNRDANLLAIIPFRMTELALPISVPEAGS